MVCKTARKNREGVTLCLMVFWLSSVSCNHAAEKPQGASVQSGDSKPVVPPPKFTDRNTLVESKAPPPSPQPVPDLSVRQLRVSEVKPQDFDPGLGLEGCRAQGKVWIPISAATNLSTCGPSPAPFCCSFAELRARFPQYGRSLDEAITTREGWGLKLYGCSLTANGQTVLHFAGVADMMVRYEEVAVDTVATTKSSGLSCPAPVSMSEMGLSSGPAVAPLANPGL